MKVLKFGAVWCPGCLIMKPRWAEIEQEHPWLQTEYHDYDDERNTAERYNVTDKLPVFVFLDKNNNEIERLQGEIKKYELVRIITEYKDR